MDLINRKSASGLFLVVLLGVGAVLEEPSPDASAPVPRSAPVPAPMAAAPQVARVSPAAAPVAVPVAEWSAPAVAAPRTAATAHPRLATVAPAGPTRGRSAPLPQDAQAAAQAALAEDLAVALQ